MLKNFNNLIKNIIIESAETTDDEQRIKNVYHCNEFYNRFLYQLAIEHNVLLTKQRNNVFLVGGLFKDIIKFFDGLKVDKDFMDNPNEFEIYELLYTFDDEQYRHIMNRDEQYPNGQGYENVQTTHDDDNIVRRVIQGRWFEFFENEEKGQKLLNVVPNKFKKYIKQIQKKFNLTNDDKIFIEFTVNCEQWKNNIFDAEYRSEDDINDFVSNDKRNIDDDFDYTQAVKLSKDNDDSYRKALKDIKKTEKTYKENKIK